MTAKACRLLVLSDVYAIRKPLNRRSAIQKLVFVRQKKIMDAPSTALKARRPVQ